VKVDHPLDPEKNQWGAVELAARYHTLAFDPRVFDTGFASRDSSARVAHAWTIGLTWHFARRVESTRELRKNDVRGRRAPTAATWRPKGSS
jgi:phosphate-selective porin